mgnify:CR=1 FL=1
MECLKRLARYLIGAKRMCSVCPRQEVHKTIESWSDSNWAGCLETRKSTSGGIIKIGNHVVKGWSTTQSVIALSSGEAEFYAIVKAASQALGLRAMAKDFGIEYNITVITDATAARGMSIRRGLGQVRHVETNQLWIQDRVRRGDIHIEKVGGRINIADALTKEAAAESIRMHINGSSMIYRDGRHELAPAIDDDNIKNVYDV